MEGAQTPWQESIRQLDAVRVSSFPFVFLGKNLFQPMRLSLRSLVIHERGILEDNELFAATVTPKRAHFRERWCALSCLTLFDRHCFH